MYWEAPPERSTFFWLQLYERVGILLIEVYERVGKSVIWACERAQSRLTDEFYGFIKSKKRSIRYVEGVLSVNKRYTKGVPFSQKMVFKRVRG